MTVDGEQSGEEVRAEEHGRTPRHDASVPETNSMDHKFLRNQIREEGRQVQVWIQVCREDHRGQRIGEGTMLIASVVPYTFFTSGPDAGQKHGRGVHSEESHKPLSKISSIVAATHGGGVHSEESQKLLSKISTPWRCTLGRRGSCID